MARTTTRATKRTNSTFRSHRLRILKTYPSPWNTPWPTFALSNWLLLLVSFLFPNPNRDTLLARPGSKRRFFGWKRPMRPPQLRRRQKRNSPRNSSASAIGGFRTLPLHGPTPMSIFSASTRTWLEVAPRPPDRTENLWTRRAGRSSASSIQIQHSSAACQGSVYSVSWKLRQPERLIRTDWSSKSCCAKSPWRIHMCGAFTLEQGVFHTIA